MDPESYHMKNFYPQKPAPGVHFSSPPKRFERERGIIKGTSLHKNGPLMIEM